MRTNIVIDDELMEEVMKLTGFKTKRETVDEALRLLARIKRQEEIRKVRGKLKWEGELDDGQRGRLQKFRDMMNRLSNVSTVGRKFTRDEMNER